MIIRRFLRLLLRGVVLLIGFAILTWPYFWPRADQRGVWRTEGYGLVLDIRHLWVTAHLQIGAYCVPYFSAPGHSLILSEIGDVSFDTAEDRLHIHVEGTVNPIEATRIAVLPDACKDGGTPQPPGTPQENFEFAWAAFSEHYPFFDLHGIDWMERRFALIPQVDPSTDDADLWRLLTEMLQGLDDGHIYLYDPATGDGFSPSADLGWEQDIPQFQSVLRRRDLIGVGDTGLEYAVLPGNIGYVYLRHTDARPGIGTSLSRIAQAGFAEVAQALAGTEAIILDNRFNPGGTDTVALAYAGFFTEGDFTAFTKETRTAGGYTAPYPAVVTGRGGLSQPVYLLNSGFTASAAEIFTTAMQELPQVTIAGEPSAGALSDMLQVTLPNGWIMGLSHQVYRDAGGTLWEGVGLPVDLPLPFDAEAMRRGEDPQLEALLGHIRETHDIGTP